MGILDGIVEWIAEQVMNGLDLITTSVLGALGCNMDTFLRYFPAAETMYSIFVAAAIGLVLLNWVWQLFKNFGLIAGLEAEDPFKLSIRSVLFIGLIYYCDQITDLILEIGGTPYSWILTSDLPPLNFADFNSVLLTILGVCANGSIALIALILVLILAWNYIKLLFEAAERYILLGVIVYTAPMSFATGASQSTSNIFKSWCRMFGGADLPASYERMVPAPVYIHGGELSGKPAFTVRRKLTYEKETFTIHSGSYTVPLPVRDRVRCYGVGSGGCWKGNRRRERVYLVPLRHRLFKNQPEDRQLPVQPRHQCWAHRRLHDGGADGCGKRAHHCQIRGRRLLLQRRLCPLWRNHKQYQCLFPVRRACRGCGKTVYPECHAHYDRTKKQSDQPHGF